MLRDVVYPHVNLAEALAVGGHRQLDGRKEGALDGREILVARKRLLKITAAGLFRPFTPN